MESVFFPATSPTRETRVASLVSALDTAAHLLTTPPVMYIVLPLELVNVKQWSSQITKAKSELEAAVIAQQQQKKRIVQDPSSNDDNASMIEIEAPHRQVSARLAPLFQIEAAEDIRAILRWRAGSTGTVSLMNSFESLFVRLVDPTLLEEPNVSLSTLLSPHQQLFLVVDDVLQPRFTERHPDPREVQQWLPPSAFSLPSSKLPKGRIALHLSYSLVLRLLRDQLTIEVSRQLRRLATELIAKARLPLVLSFFGEWHCNNVETSLALRAQPDLYALLGSLMFGDAQRTLFAEAKGFLRKGHHHSPIREWVTSWEEMTSRRTRPTTQRPPPSSSAERDGHSSSNGGSTKGRRQKRRREENHEDDGRSESNVAVAPTTVIEPDPCDDLELIEDARCA